MMYYYKRKSNPFKWVIIVLIFMVLGAIIYWFYSNYFSKIEINKNDNTNNSLISINTPAVMASEISLNQGDVQVAIGQNNYEKAISQAILHQGDKVKTGLNSLAVLDLGNDSKIRLAANTEVVLQNLDEKNVLVELIFGRIYNNISLVGQYQVKTGTLLFTSLGTKFEVQADPKAQAYKVLVFDHQVKLEIKNQDEVVMSSRLDANDQAAVNLTAAKKDWLKLDTFNPQDLAKDTWYQWNFNLDSGQSASAPDQAAYTEVSDSLQLVAQNKPEGGVDLTWSVYKQADFKSYQILRSETDSALKFPDTQALKVLTSKDLSAYLDKTVKPQKTYYYRVCTVKISNNVACGNVATLQTPVKDATPPVSPNLSATVSATGVFLSWNANSEPDFKEYRILKSITDPNPSFPTINYLVKQSLGQESYLDKEVNITSPGSDYYRVCSLDLANNFSCSNVVWVENGVVQ